MTGTNFLRSAGGWVLFASLAFAPWALGSRPLWAVNVLAALLLGALALWVISHIKEGTPPVLGTLPVICVGLLVAQGWWMVLNAHGKYVDPNIAPVNSWLPNAAGAVDGPVCRSMMLQITGVLAALLVASDLATEHAWRWRMIAAMGVTAFSIAVWGLFQKIGVLPALAHREYQESVFATFDYHGNAGAFLNLGIPAVFALAVRRHRLGGVAALLVCVAAAMVNVSRAGAAIAIVICFVLIAWKRWARVRMAAMPRPALGLILLGAFVIATIAAGGAAWRRWNTLQSMEVENNPRLIMLQIATPMAVDAGLFGYGPGSFKLIYPNSPHMLGDLYRRWKVQPYHIGKQPSIYSFVHDDYVQYVIEWGAVGGLIWAVLFLAAIVRGVRSYSRGGDKLVIAISLIALGGVLAHAFVDWPLQVASLQLDVAVYLGLLFGEPCASS